MEFVDYLIIGHASLGGIALVSGGISMFSRKGKKQHRRTGQVFVLSMVLSALVSIPVCFIPGHENMLLFSIAVFTIYCILSGQRALLFKVRNLKNIQIWKDWLISGVMLCFGAALFIEGFFKILYPNGPTLLFFFFGTLSSFFRFKTLCFTSKKTNQPLNTLKGILV